MEAKQPTKHIKQNSPQFCRMDEYKCQCLLPSVRLFVAAKEAFYLGIPESTAGDDIHEDEDNDSNDEDNVGLPPFFPEVSQKASLAGDAVVAQLARIVTP